MCGCGFEWILAVRAIVKNGYEFALTFIKRAESSSTVCGFTVYNTVLSLKFFAGSLMLPARWKVGNLPLSTVMLSSVCSKSSVSKSMSMLSVRSIQSSISSSVILLLYTSDCAV